MSSRKATQEYRLSQWLPIIKECRASGMTVRLWCQKNNVNEKQFYYWQSKLRTIASESLLVPTEQQQTKFVPLSFLTTQTTCHSVFAPTMVIRMGHVAIELASQVEPELLASVLKALNNAQ